MLILFLASLTQKSMGELSRPISTIIGGMSSTNPLQLQLTEEKRLQWRARSLKDLYWFAGTVLNYGDRVPIREGPHALLCKFVEKRTGHNALDGARYRKIEMPRETGKTTLVTEAYVVQRICANQDIAILIANEKEQNAKDFLSEIKHQFETNELLRALFPEVIPPDFNDTTWSASRIIVNRQSGRKEPTVSVIGVGGTVTGMHYDLIVCDDIISREAMENARAGSWQIMHQVNRWIHQLEPLLNSNADPFPEIIFIGTRWWHKDSYEHIEDAFGYGDVKRPFLLRWKDTQTAAVQQVTAYRQGDLAMFRRAAIEDGRSIFPEKWDLEKLAKIRVRDEALFACNYLNNPSDEVTATFRESWLLYYEMLDDETYRITDGTGAKRTYALDDLDRLLFVDPGGFGSRANEDRARAAIVAVGSSARGEHLLLDAYSEKDTFLACLEKLCEWSARFSPRKIVIEQAGQQAAFIEMAKRMLAEKGASAPVEAVKPGVKAKEQRILLLEPFFQQGHMFIGRGPNFHEFRNQYIHFPRSARLDLLDALSYFPEKVKRLPRSPTDHARRRAEELATYYSSRGIPQP